MHPASSLACLGTPTRPKLHDTATLHAITTRIPRAKPTEPQTEQRFPAQSLVNLLYPHLSILCNQSPHPLLRTRCPPKSPPNPPPPPPSMDSRIATSSPLGFLHDLGSRESPYYRTQQGWTRRVSPAATATPTLPQD